MTDSFLSRWSKRKAEVQAEEKVDQEKLDSQKKDLSESADQHTDSGKQGSVEITPPTKDVVEGYKGPTMEDVKNLTKESDFSPFVAKDVDPSVQQAAMKTLFSDPHFNVMDGLDIYIDDYSKPDPLPPGMLEKMVQSGMLGLFKSKVDEQLSSSAELSKAALQSDQENIDEITRSDKLQDTKMQETKALESDVPNPIQASNLELPKNTEKKSES